MTYVYYGESKYKDLDDALAEFPVKDLDDATKNNRYIYLDRNYTSQLITVDSSTTIYNVNGAINANAPKGVIYVPFNANNETTGDMKSSSQYGIKSEFYHGLFSSKRGSEIDTYYGIVNDETVALPNADELSWPNDEAEYKHRMMKQTAKKSLWDNTTYDTTAYTTFPIYYDWGNVPSLRNEKLLFEGDEVTIGNAKFSKEDITIRHLENNTDPSNRYDITVYPNESYWKDLGSATEEFTIFVAEGYPQNGAELANDIQSATKQWYAKFGIDNPADLDKYLNADTDEVEGDSFSYLYELPQFIDIIYKYPTFNKQVKQTQKIEDLKIYTNQYPDYYSMIKFDTPFLKFFNEFVTKSTVSEDWNEILKDTNTVIVNLPSVDSSRIYNYKTFLVLQFNKLCHMLITDNYKAAEEIMESMLERNGHPLIESIATLFLPSLFDTLMKCNGTNESFTIERYTYGNCINIKGYVTGSSSYNLDEKYWRIPIDNSGTYAINPTEAEKAAIDTIKTNVDKIAALYNSNQSKLVRFSEFLNKALTCTYTEGNTKKTGFYGPALIYNTNEGTVSSNDSLDTIADFITKNHATIRIEFNCKTKAWSKSCSFETFKRTELTVYKMIIEPYNNILKEVSKADDKATVKGCVEAIIDAIFSYFSWKDTITIILPLKYNVSIHNNNVNATNWEKLRTPISYLFNVLDRISNTNTNFKLLKPKGAISINENEGYYNFKTYEDILKWLSKVTSYTGQLTDTQNTEFNMAIDDVLGALCSTKESTKELTTEIATLKTTFAKEFVYTTNETLNNYERSKLKQYKDNITKAITYPSNMAVNDTDYDTFKAFIEAINTFNRLVYPAEDVTGSKSLNYKKYFYLTNDVADILTDYNRMYESIMKSNIGDYSKYIFKENLIQLCNFIIDKYNVYASKTSDISKEAQLQNDMKVSDDGYFSFTFSDTISKDLLSQHYVPTERVTEDITIELNQMKDNVTAKFAIGDTKIETIYDVVVVLQRLNGKSISNIKENIERILRFLQKIYDDYSSNKMKGEINLGSTSQKVQELLKGDVTGQSRSALYCGRVGFGTKFYRDALPITNTAADNITLYNIRELIFDHIQRPYLITRFNVPIPSDTTATDALHNVTIEGVYVDDYPNIKEKLKDNASHNTNRDTIIAEYKGNLQSNPPTTKDWNMIFYVKIPIASTAACPVKYAFYSNTISKGKNVAMCRCLYFWKYLNMAYIKEMVTQAMRDRYRATKGTVKFIADETAFDTDLPDEVNLFSDDELFTNRSPNRYTQKVKFARQQNTPRPNDTSTDIFTLEDMLCGNDNGKYIKNMIITNNEFQIKCTVPLKMIYQDIKETALFEMKKNLFIITNATAEYWLSVVKKAIPYMMYEIASALNASNKTYITANLFEYWSNMENGKFYEIPIGACALTNPNNIITSFNTYGTRFSAIGRKAADATRYNVAFEVVDPVNYLDSVFQDMISRSFILNRATKPAFVIKLPQSQYDILTMLMQRGFNNEEFAYPTTTDEANVLLTQDISCIVLSSEKLTNFISVKTVNVPYLNVDRDGYVISFDIKTREFHIYSKGVSCSIDSKTMTCEYAEYAYPDNLIQIK